VASSKRSNTTVFESWLVTERPPDDVELVTDPWREWALSRRPVARKLVAAYSGRLEKLSGVAITENVPGL